MYSDKTRLTMGEVNLNVSKITKRKRGRPKGSTSMTLATARKIAKKEKKELRKSLMKKITSLKNTLQNEEKKHKKAMRKLHEEVLELQQKEMIYRNILEKKIDVVADHLHSTLINWAKAELSEAIITKRRRGRPRKTLK